MGAIVRRWGWAAVAAVAVLPGIGQARDAQARDAKVIPLAAVAPADVRSPVETRPAAAAEPRVLGFEARQMPPVQGDMTVMVDRAKIIRLPDRTQSVVIGNPAVADIAVQKSGVVVLTGKSFGVTNFIAVDAGGNQIAESRISVTAPSDGTLLVQRGLDRQTYSCAPTCQPTVALGDANAYFGETKGQIDAHGAFVGQR